jgi:hypothetical protein
VNIRLATLATILMVTSGCDKAKEFVRAGRSAGPPQVAPAEELDLSANPDIVFQVFGEASDPRMIPVASVQSGKLRPIVLTEGGWRQFDAQYLRRGKSYTIYQDGRPSGSLKVRRGMWERADHPLYALPGCHALTPLAAVEIADGHPRTGFTTELLASTARLGRERPAASLSRAELVRVAREVAANVGKSLHVAPKTLDSLDFHVESFISGASDAPTIVASFIDPAAESSRSAGAVTTHVLVIADRDSTGAYHATYAHRLHGRLTTASFRRYFDHLDLTGDGVDEIVLEGWRFGGDTFLSVLGFKNGRWREVFRTRPNWCLDERNGN